jgi:type II secretory pathway component PulF
MLIQFWSTGQESGQMDEMLQKLSNYFEEEWTKSLNLLIAWIPKIVYGAVMIYAGFQIYQMGLRYTKAIDQSMGF